MHAITLPARCVNKQIVLTQPMEISEDSELLVTIFPPASRVEHDPSFRQDWSALGGAALERAYSGEEPEYTTDMLKKVNPDYAAG